MVFIIFLLNQGICNLLYTIRTAHAIQASRDIDFIAHCRQYCFFCVDLEVQASPIVVDTWTSFLKCVLSEKGPYESKRLQFKFPQLLADALNLARCIFPLFIIGFCHSMCKFSALCCFMITVIRLPKWGTSPNHCLFTKRDCFNELVGRMAGCINVERILLCFLEMHFVDFLGKGFS